MQATRRLDRYRRRLARRAVVPAALALGGVLWTPTAAVQAVGGVVNLRCGDVAGLISAMATAAPAEVINLNSNSISGCVYPLTAPVAAGSGLDGLPPVTTALTIRGNGAAIVRDATATAAFRILEVTPLGALTLADTTVAGGAVSFTQCDLGAGACGGGIWNDGLLTLTAVTLSGNQGSGLRNDGTASLRATTVRGNTATEYGGGIYNSFNSTLLLVHSAVVGNSAGFGGGGGIYNGGTLSTVSSVVSGNSATDFSSGFAPAAFGGGIYNASTAVLANTAVRDNIANGSGASVGGGIYNEGGTLTIIDGAVDGNRAIQVNGPSVATGGGGIFNDVFAGSVGHVALVGGEVRDNAAGNGGGIDNAGSRTSVVVSGTKFTGNTPDNCAPSGSVVGCRG